MPRLFRGGLCARSTSLIVSACWRLGVNANQFGGGNPSDNHPDQITSFGGIADSDVQHWLKKEFCEDHGSANGSENACRATEAHGHRDDNAYKQERQKASHSTFTEQEST